jgi:hypothetical protein
MFRFFFQQKLVYCYLGFLFEFTFWIFLFLVWFLLGFVVCIWLIKFSLHSEFLSYLFIFKRWILSIKFDMFGWKWYLGNIWGGKRILPCFILISWALSTYLFSPLPYTTITNLGRFTDPLISSRKFFQNSIATLWKYDCVNRSTLQFTSTHIAQNGATLYSFFFTVPFDSSSFICSFLVLFIIVDFSIIRIFRDS